MTQFSFVFKIVFTFIFLSWFYLLVSSAAGAESVPFPKEPIATSTHRMDDKLMGGGGVGGIGSGGNGMAGPGSERFSDRDSYVLAFINFTYSAPDGEEIRRSEEKARYGEGRILNVQGNLVHVTREHNVSDHTACTENIRGTSNKPLPPRGEPWIALVRRGACTFEKKIRHVWLQGAAGVIVYNDEASVSLEKMKIIEKERNITAVFTFRWIGEEMARVVDNNQKVWVSISEGSRGYRPTNINKTSVLFVSISFIILMVISLVWLIFYYIQRFRYLQSKDQNERNLCSAAKRIIMKIPTKSGKNEDKDNETDCCAICIENYKSTDCIRVLPCRHEFHKNCIDPWLLEHRTCPMCKLDILKHYGFVVGDPIIVSLTPDSPPASPLVTLNTTTTTNSSNITTAGFRNNNSLLTTSAVAVVTNTRPNFDPSQLEEIIEPSPLITTQPQQQLQQQQHQLQNNSNSLNNAINIAPTSSSNTILTANNICNQDLSRNLLLLKQNSNSDIIINDNNSLKNGSCNNVNSSSMNSNCNNSNYCNNSNSNNSNNCNLNTNLNRSNYQQYNNQYQYHHPHSHSHPNHHHHHHPHHQHSHSLSNIIVTTNDEINQNFNSNSNNYNNISNNSDNSNNSQYQLPRISTSANHILQNFTTNTTTSSRQIIGSEESIIDLDLDVELGRSRLSRRRNSDQSLTTNLTPRPISPSIIVNRNGLTTSTTTTTTTRLDDTQFLQVPTGRRRSRSSSLQLLSPFNKHREIIKTIQPTINTLSPDDIRNLDMDLNSIRKKPVIHKRLRSRSADACRDLCNRRPLTIIPDYQKFKNEASTSGTNQKSKRFLENIQLQTTTLNDSLALMEASTSKEIKTPCNITIRITPDEDSANKENIENKINSLVVDRTSHL